MEEVLPIAAALSIQDPRDRPMDKQDAADQAQQEFRHPDSDFLTLLNIWKRFRENGEKLSHSKVRAWCRESFLSYTRMREWLETFHQLREIAGDLGLRFNGQPASEDAIHRSLLTGLIGNMACRNEADGGFDYLAPRGNKVQIFPGSVLFKKGPKWIVAGEVVQTTKTYARTLAKIKPEWIEELAPHLIKRSFSDIHWQHESGQVCAFERVTVLGMTIVPRRRVHYGPMNPKHARELFIHHALVEGELSTEGSFAVHNRQVMDKARSIEARLRRQDVLSENTARFAFFDARVPAEVYSAGAFELWRKEAERKTPRVLCMWLEHVLRPDLVQEAGGDRFPDALDLGSAGAPCRGTLEYVMDPGSERDGIIATVPLESLAQLEPARCEWLVPGMVYEKVHHLLRTLPKAHRQALGGGSSNQVTGPLRTLAEELSQVMTFGQGTLTGAMSEAIRVLKGVDVPREAWNVSGVPGYLMLTLRVVDQHGKELAAGRDIEEIQGRLAGRARRALEGLARKEFAREGITSWDFDPLPETFETQRGGTKVVGYPALADAGESVSLTLATSRDEAEASTRRGLVRLFVLAAKDELVYRIRLLPDDMFKHYAALGPAAELRGDLMDLIAEQTFLAGQPVIRSRQEFEARQTQCWGKMGTVAMEVGNLAASVLALRQQIAGRMGAGVPRTWAASVTDIREHSAFLMPPRFLKHVEILRMKQYPRYLDAVRRRLEKLREGGAAKEARGLTEIAPPWKRWTAWVAQTHAKALKMQQESGEPAEIPTSGSGKAGLLPAQRGKRGAVVVPTDAAAWAMLPGSMSPEVAAYRWMLEELRVSLFAQELGTAMPVSAKRLDEAWAKVVAAQA
jgi:ATP-dependent helicase HrpA